MRTNRVWTAIIAVIASGCVQQEVVSPSARELIVHAILDADVRTQDVIVQQSNGTVSSQVGIVGATVTITTPEGTVMTADEVRDSTAFAVQSFMAKVGIIYRISLDRYGVTLVPGGIYKLTVISGGHTVTGTTIVPARAFVATAGGAEPFSASDTLRLAWRPVPFAHAYEVSVSPLGRTASYYTIPDTTIAISGSGVPFSAGRTNVVTVAAVDANYYDYFRRSSDQFTGSGVINRLEGGIGVFGAVSRITTRVLAVK